MFPKKYFGYILNFKPGVSREVIDHAIKERNKQKVSQESKIEISAEIMGQINKKHFYSRPKGRALSMIFFQEVKSIRLIDRERENINLMK